VEHLGRGVELAWATVDGLQTDADSADGLSPRSWVRRLTPFEQNRVRTDAAELILLEARARLLKAVDLDVRDFWAWFALGLCHFEQGRFAEAAGDYATCAAIEPRFAWPYLNRGVCLARLGRLSQARSAYRRALDANPRFAEAWLNLGLACLELNELESAEEGFTRAWSYGRREASVLAARAEVKARRGDRPGADRMFQGLLRSRPDDAVVLVARGTFLARDDPSAAEADFCRVLAAEPRNARAHFGLALLRRKDEPREALAEVDAAVSEDPGLLDAVQLRALLRARLGDPAAAEDAERVCLDPSPHRLYNASCALAIIAATAPSPQHAPRALELLGRALDAGFPASQAATDPDLAALRALPGYRALLEKTRPAAREARPPA
jgi:tetratricopeptide (TPR) repeat protein